MKAKIIICVLCGIISILIGGTSAYFMSVNTNKSVSVSAKKIENKNIIVNEKKKTDILKNKKLVPVNAELTAYCNCKICSEEWGSQTAMMTVTKKGVVAAPSEIPLGSTLYIPSLKDYKSDGMFSVEDRGGEVKVKDDGTYIIDIWLSNHKDVIKFGRKKCTVYLVEDNK